MRHHLRRRLHPRKQRRYKEQSRHCGQHGGYHAEQKIGMDRLLHTFIIPGAIVPRDDDPAAHRDPVKESDDQKSQATPGTDRRKIVIVRKITHHPGIRHIVKLLQQLPEKKRYRKLNDLLYDSAFGQIDVLRMASLFVMYMKNVCFLLLLICVVYLYLFSVTLPSSNLLLISMALYKTLVTITSIPSIT